MRGAGFYRHLVQIQRPTRAADGRGGNSTTWPTFARPPAFVRPIEVEDSEFAEGIKSEATTVVYTRHVPNVTNDCRIVFRTRVLNIVGVVDVGEQGNELAIACKESAD